MVQKSAGRVVNRCTALELASERGVHESKALARQLLESYQPAALKVAALAANTHLGEPEAEALLRPYLRSEDLRLRSAVTHAIRQIRLRG